jgi:hypothetical protein
MREEAIVSSMYDLFTGWSLLRCWEWETSGSVVEVAGRIGCWKGQIRLSIILHPYPRKEEQSVYAKERSLLGEWKVAMIVLI